MSVGRIHGRTNQEGDLAPWYSPWGQAFRAGTPILIDHPAPIGSFVHGGKPYGGTIGPVLFTSANVGVLPGRFGYGGDAPQDLQGIVDAPPPWERP